MKDEPQKQYDMLDEQQRRECYKCNREQCSGPLVRVAYSATLIRCWCYASASRSASVVLSASQSR